MPDKSGPSREHERFPKQNEIKPIDTGKEIRKLAKSIDPNKQMPKSSQKKIEKMLSKCKEGQYKKQSTLINNGYKPFAMGKFSDPDNISPGHIGYLFANNVLTEGREIEIGKYKDGYAFYSKPNKA